MGRHSSEKRPANWPKSLIMGEIRGPEALNALQAGLAEPGSLLASISVRLPRVLTAETAMWFMVSNNRPSNKTQKSTKQWRIPH